MSKHVKYSFDKLTGRAVVIIWDKGRRYRGVAVPHKDDMDVISEFTGLTIAEAKAETKRFRGKASDVNQKIKKLYAEIELLTARHVDYMATADEIEKNLSQYIDDKAKFAANLRRVRAKRAIGNETKPKDVLELKPEDLK